MPIQTTQWSSKVIASLRRQLRSYFQQHHLRTAIFGKSKGVDSSVIAGLLSDIQGIIPIGVLLPCESEPEDETIGREVLAYYNIPSLTIDLTKSFHDFKNALIYTEKIDSQLAKIKFKGKKVKKFNESRKYAWGNIKARLRMIVLYHIARLTKGAVIASGNRSEYMTGFWTLHGDVGDLYPLAKLTKTQVYTLAGALHVPASSLHAVPTDGLNIAGTDEEQLGLSYAKLDQIIEADLDQKNRPFPILPGITQNEITRALSRIRSTDYKRRLPIRFNPF